MTLSREPNINDSVGFYGELLRFHEGLSDVRSQALNARLIITLATHIGERSVVSAAIEATKGSPNPDAAPSHRPSHLRALTFRPDHERH